MVASDLYLPQSRDQDRARCRRAGIPDDIVYQPKWRIGIELQVRSECYVDSTEIWTVDTFPIRFKVKPLVLLKVEHGIPVKETLPQMSWDPETRSGYVRSSPSRIDAQDADVILVELTKAQNDPVYREYESNKIKSVPTYFVKTAGGKPISRISSGIRAA